MANPQAPQPLNTDEAFWTDLGLKYEAAFSHDTGQTRLIQTYLSKLPPTASILDCGSGTGKPVAVAIAASGRHVHGIDLSAGMVSLSRKAVPGGTFEVANMLEYAPPAQTDGSGYDGVVASLSIFELSRSEVGTMSRKWFEWLRAGGLLLINTFAAEACEQVKDGNWDADRQCATKVEWMFMGNNVLITLFTKAGWKALLEEAGFEIVHTEEDLFQPRAEARCDLEPHYYIIAKKPSSN